MDYAAIYRGMTVTAKTLWASMPVKLAGSAFMTMLLHQHAVLFYLFVFLVFMDCFTRWMSISYERLVKNGEDAHVPAVLKGIKAARADGLISSNVMKHRFVGKILVYIICVVAAAATDLSMKTLGNPTWAVETVISYLVLTELLSIVENLNDAGIEMMSGLIQVLKRKG